MLRRVACEGGASEVKSDRKAETPTNEEILLETRVEGARTDYHQYNRCEGITRGTIATSNLASSRGRPSSVNAQTRFQIVSSRLSSVYNYNKTNRGPL